MFADCHELDAAGGSFLRHAYCFRDRRHVAVFMGHPDDARAAAPALGFERDELDTVLDARDEGLFDEDRQIRRKRVAHDRRRGRSSAWR